MRAAIRQILFAGNPFSPLSLFRAGEQGAWYDPSDQATLFATHDGTTPGVAVGNPVGKILDKSGRGNHATQSTLAARPTLQVDENGNYYLLFDGVDDALQTASINMLSTTKASVFAGYTRNTTGQQVLAEFGNPITDSNSFTIQAQGANTNKIRATIFGNGSGGSGVDSAGTYTPPITLAQSVMFDTDGASSTTDAIIRVNGAQIATTSISDTNPSGGLGNWPLYIGARTGTSLRLTGRLYSLIIRGAQSTATQITQIETWVNSKTRAY